MLTKDIWPLPAATITCRMHSETLETWGFLYWLKCSSFKQSVWKNLRNLLLPAVLIFFFFLTKLFLSFESWFDIYSFSRLSKGTEFLAQCFFISRYFKKLFGAWGDVKVIQRWFCWVRKSGARRHSPIRISEEMLPLILFESQSSAVYILNPLDYVVCSRH